MVPNPLEERCDNEIELPVFYEDTNEEDTVIYSCKGKRFHDGLHHSWQSDTDDKDGALIVWPVEEDMEVPDELA